MERGKNHGPLLRYSLSLNGGEGEREGNRFSFCYVILLKKLLLFSQWNPAGGGPAPDEPTLRIGPQAPCP